MVRYSKSRIELFEPGHNITLWLHRLNTVRSVQGWSDADAIREASLLMGNTALTWFLTHCNQLTPWPDFEHGMRQRFGDSEQTIIARIQHRKQHEEECVQSYIDDMNMMFAQSVFPEVLKRNLLIDNMKPSLRKQVLSSIPTTIEHVIENALFLEDTAAPVTSEKIRGWEQQSSHSKLDPVDRITKAMDKLTLALSGNCDRQSEYSRVSLDRSRVPKSSQIDFRAGPVQYCQGYGHEDADCDSMPSNDVGTKLLESTCDRYHNTLGSDDCTPTTPEAQEYAKRLSRDWRQRRHQVRPWISQAASQSVADCCMVVSGSDTAQTQATCTEPAHSAVTPGDKSAKDKDLACVLDEKALVTSTLQTGKQPATDQIPAQANSDTAHTPKSVLQPEGTRAKPGTQNKKQTQGFASPFSFTFSKPAQRTSRAPSPTALKPDTAQTDCKQTDQVQETALYVASKLQKPACEAAVAVELAKHAETGPDKTPHLTNTSVSGDAQTAVLSDSDDIVASKLSSIAPCINDESTSVLTECASVDSPVCLVGKESPVSTVLTEILPKPSEAFSFAAETPPESVPTSAQSCTELSECVSKGDSISLAIAQPDNGMLLSQTRHLKLTVAHQFPIELGDVTLTPSVDLQDWSVSCTAQKRLSNTAFVGASLPAVLGGLHYMSKDPDKLNALALLSQNNVVKTLTTTQDRMHDSGQCNISQPLWTQDNPTKTDSNAAATWIDMIVKTVLPSKVTPQTMPDMRYITPTRASMSHVLHSMVQGLTLSSLLHLVSSSRSLKRQHGIKVSKLGDRPYFRCYADSMTVR